jgi:Fe-Mn family superoxide dismutase
VKLVRPIPLPFRIDYLEPYMGEETIRLHYGELTTGYVDRANYLIRAEAKGKEVDQDRLAFELNGAELHRLWWENLAPVIPGQKRRIPHEVLLAFGGNTRSLKRELIAAGMSIQGSGWVMLGRRKGRKGRVEVKTIPNHRVSHNHEPLLLLDCWEHSYLLDYGGDRKTYLNEVLKVVNWDVVAGRLLV